jgi:PhnB protein
MTTDVCPQLAVRRSAAAVEFYKAAFGATEIYRVDDGAGHVVSQLSVDGAEFWVSEEAPAHGNFSPESLNGATTKMLLRVDDPDSAFARAVEAGATGAQAPQDEHGWRLGKVIDPYGHHWEIGRPLGTWPPAAH